ncbi:MAG: hypothetical protein WBM61_13100 [Woeseiaceae bacterium]|jgi:hypothetical protein
MLIANVVMAGVFVWIDQRGKDSKPWLAQGLRFGIAVALLAAVPTCMIYFVVQPIPEIMAIKQIIDDGGFLSILGVVVAILNRSAESA